MMTLRISVVIPTYRRRDLLLRCIAALAEQDVAEEEYEVIVADDENSEETHRVLQPWIASRRPAVRYVPVTSRHGPAAARNAGWRAAGGEIIAFTDDDCLPERGWLRAGAAEIDAGADAAWGRLEMPLPLSPTDYELDAAGLANSVFVTANCFCRRAVLERVAGFDERFTAAWREDSDLYFSLLEQGFRVAHAPRAVVRHPIRGAPWAVSLRQQAKTKFDALLQTKHPELYHQQIGRMPRLYYGVAASLAVACLGLTTDAPLLGWAGAASWSGLTLTFCLRRLRATSKSPSHVAEMALTSALIPPLSLYWRLQGILQFGWRRLPRAEVPTGSHKGNACSGPNRAIGSCNPP